MHDMWGSEASPTTTSIILGSYSGPGASRTMLCKPSDLLSMLSDPLAHTTTARDPKKSNSYREHGEIGLKAHC